MKKQNTNKNIDTEQYKFHNAEIGISSEIFLPKKLQYQSVLNNSLEVGLMGFSFSKHYKNNRRCINTILERYPSIGSPKPGKLKLFDQLFPEILKGFSTTEVDGAYKFNELTKQGKSLSRFSEERTQIIKVIFLPEYEKMAHALNKAVPTSLLDIYPVISFTDMFFTLTKATSFDQRFIDMRLKPWIEDPAQLRLLGLNSTQQALFLRDYLKQWIDAVAFFIYGYMLVDICKNLKKMYKDERIRYMEEEIWVESQWGVLINKFVLNRY